MYEWRVDAQLQSYWKIQRIYRYASKLHDIVWYSITNVARQSRMLYVSNGTDI